MKHCCDGMLDAVEEGSVLYSPPTRLYACFIDRQEIELRVIGYCPFCGKQLPEDLVDEYDDAVEAVMGRAGLELICNNQNFLKPSPLLPKEFQTEEWWRKRGL